MMPALMRTRTARAALAALLAMAVCMAAITSTISGQETLPAVSISATGGARTVTEGTDASFTIAANPAPAADLEVGVSVHTTRDFTGIPDQSSDEYLLSTDKIEAVTIPKGSTQALLVIPTMDDTVDEEDGSVSVFLLSSTDSQYVTGPTTGQTIQVQDNDPTAPPETMAQPTLLPTDGGLELFWEEPAHYGDRPIHSYSMEWTPFTASRGGARGSQRHQSITGLTNGAEYSVRIRACKGITCGEYSDPASATPTASGPAITGPATATLPEEAEGTVGQYSASGTITWRLGGDDAGFFSQSVNPDGSMTLKLKAGANYDTLRYQHGGANLQVTVVASDSAQGHASTTKDVDVALTNVDEAPTFPVASITRPTYNVGQEIERFVLPAVSADEVPVTHETTGLPPGLERSYTRLISGTPKEAGTFTAEHKVTDGDGDEAILEVHFTVVEPTNRAPTVDTEIENLHMNPGDSPRTIDLSDKFQDPDGDTLIFTSTSDNTNVATTTVTGNTLSLTPTGEGRATITVTASDREPADTERLQASQEFTVTVASETIALSLANPNMGRGESRTLLVTGIDLDPAETYSLEATLDGEEAAFDAGCADRTATGELATVLTGPRVKSFVIHGCKLGEAEITVKLLLGTTELHQATATATVTGAPDKPAVNNASTGEGHIILNIELGHSVDSFEVKQSEGTTTTTLDFNSAAVTVSRLSTNPDGPTDSLVGITGLLNGVEYRYTVVSTNVHGINTSDEHTVPLQPVPPVNLDLQPRPLRHAAISWKNRANSTDIKYTIDIRSTDNTLVRPLTTDQGLVKEVALDDLIDSAGSNTNDPKGLGHSPYAWLVRVKAQGIPGTGLNDSDYSENLIIIDTPITTANGNSPPGTGQGQIELTWTPIETVLGDPAYANGQYHFTYRPLRGDDTVPNWNPYNYGDIATTPRLSSRSAHTIGSLGQDRIYAVQLRYELPKRPGAQEPVRVYAARDVYARPSSSQPAANRTASFPMFGHWSSRELHYTICTNTFPVPSGNETWPGLIKHAFREWQAAASDLITMHPNEARCLDENNPFSNLMTTYNSSNEVYMVGDRTFDTFLPDWMEVFINPLHVCIETENVPACVISPDYEVPGNGPSLDLERGTQVAGRPATGVDMLIKNTTAEPASQPEIPGGNNTWAPGDVKFNTCKSSPQPRDQDERYEAYGLIIHEAGHMLGLSGLDRSVLDRDDERGHYEMSHPTLPDSVMNYDHEVPHFWSSGIAGQGERNTWEPDCSPHPFDILALYTLYQTVR